MKIRFLVTLFFVLSQAQLTFSQQKNFQWRLGASGGFTNYYGDLSPYTIDGVSNRKANRHLLYYNENYFEKPSYKVYVEKQLSATIGIMLNYGNYHFGMSDRYIQRNGDLYLDNQNFSRGLNFQNHTRDLGLSFVFKTDNDKFLSANSLIAPYFTIGAGYIRFDVKGDLLDKDGNWYDHNSIAIIHDGEYETSLPEWRTELVNGYDQDSWYANFGLGFRIRLGNRMELFAQSDFIHTFTDFLDDVSGRYRMQYDSEFQAYAAKPGTNTIDPENPYRGNPNGAKDWIIYHGIGLKFNFGASKKTFQAPRLSTYFPDNSVSLEEVLSQKMNSSLDSLNKKQKGITNNFYYSVQLIESERLDTLAYTTKILAFDQEILKRETKILEGKTKEKKLKDISRTFDSQHQNLENDTRLDPKVKQDLLIESEKARFGVRYSLDSIYRREKELTQEIDSLTELKRQLPFEQRILVFPNMDSLFQSQVSISDSVFRQSVLSSEVEDSFISSSKNNALEQEKALSENQVAATSMRTSSSENFSEARLTQIEDENKYLKSERDRILREYSEYQKNNKPKKQKPQYIENTRTIQKEKTNTVSNQEDPQRRRRWWWPFAAAGGVATVMVLSDNGESEDVPVDSASVALAFIQSEEAAVAFSSAVIGVDLRERPNKGDSGLMALEIPNDSISKEEQPKVQLFSFKEIVYFKLNQKIPDAVETEKLTQLGKFTRDNAEYRLVITGFADNTGNVNFNLSLAEERMNSVADFLKKEFGLKDDQLRLETGGQVIRGSRQAANELDRRVEVRIERK